MRSPAFIYTSAVRAGPDAFVWMTQLLFKTKKGIYLKGRCWVRAATSNWLLGDFFLLLLFARGTVHLSKRY